MSTNQLIVSKRDVVESKWPRWKSVSRRAVSRKQVAAYRQDRKP